MRAITNTSKLNLCSGQLKTPCCKCTTDDCESCSCKKELRFCTSCETPNCVNHTLNVSVLLWNIDGDKGINKARNLVVKGVVIEVDPDVILLQEVRSKPLIQEIMKRGYKKEIAGKEEEAQILYKTNKFHHTCTEERKVLETAIDDGGTRMTTRSRKELFIDRTSIVRLTTIGYNLNFVFLSFHNERHGQHSSEHFCQIVSQISQTTQCIVIAGADANDTLPFGESNGYTVLEYDATDRRKEKEIDHFIVANPSNIIIPKPEAFNFVDTKDGQKLHQQMTSLKPKLKSIKYHKVLKKGLGKKKDDAALHDALDSKLEGDLDKMVEALGKSLDKGLQEGLKKVLGKVSDKPQLHEALLNGFRKTLQEALDQALRIDEGMISNHDPILLDLTIDTKERQSRESV